MSDTTELFENVVTILSEGEEDCSYCSNKAKYLVKTNLGWNNPVCNFHLVLFGKKKGTV